MKEIEDFKTEIQNIKKLKIKAIENDFNKLISDLNFGKGLITEETKKIEAKLAKLKIPKRVINTIKK